jgi:hypothetical protein
MNKSKPTPKPENASHSLAEGLHKAFNEGLTSYEYQIDSASYPLFATFLKAAISQLPYVTKLTEEEQGDSVLLSFQLKPK